MNVHLYGHSVSFKRQYTSKNNICSFWYIFGQPAFSRREVCYTWTYFKKCLFVKSFLTMRKSTWSQRYTVAGHFNWKFPGIRLILTLQNHVILWRVLLPENKVPAPIQYSVWKQNFNSPVCHKSVIIQSHRQMLESLGWVAYLSLILATHHGEFKILFVV